MDLFLDVYRLYNDGDFIFNIDAGKNIYLWQRKGRGLNFSEVEATQSSLNLHWIINNLKLVCWGPKRTKFYVDVNQTTDFS